MMRERKETEWKKIHLGCRRGGGDEGEGEGGGEGEGEGRGGRSDAENCFIHAKKQ